MSSYGPTHVVPLVLFVIGLVAAGWLGRRHRAVDGPTRFSRTAALLIPAVTVPFQLIDLVFNFDIDITLPLTCATSPWIVATWALWTPPPVPGRVDLLLGADRSPSRA